MKLHPEMYGVALLRIPSIRAFNSNKCDLTTNANTHLFMNQNYCVDDPLQILLSSF